MSTHARKTHADASPRKASPLFNAEYMKKITNGMVGMKRQDQNAVSAINSEIFGIFSQMAAGDGMLREMQQLTNEITQSYTCHMAKLVEFSNAAMKCHRMEDMMALNAKAMQYFCRDYVNETLKLSSKFFGNEGLARLCGFSSASEEICEALGA